MTYFAHVSIGYTQGFVLCWTAVKTEVGPLSQCEEARHLGSHAEPAPVTRLLGRFRFRCKHRHLGRPVDFATVGVEINNLFYIQVEKEETMSPLSHSGDTANECLE